MLGASNTNTPNTTALATLTMSKWLRRGFGHHQQNNGSNTAIEQVQPDERQPPHHGHHHPNDFPTPPRNDMPAAASAAVYSSSHHHPASGVMGYEPTATPMDVDHNSGHRGSGKYSSSSKQYDPPSTRSASTRQMPDEHHRQSSRSSRDRRRSSYQQQRGGATNAPPTTPVQMSGHFGSTPPSGAAPQTPFGAVADPLLGTNNTPPDNGQPSFPPPAVTAESPTPPESAAAQRRPAYLLHRDLVIGKGSYGQVCIASRGEPEGHNATAASGGRSSGSGKRKKFACKCVLLRHDPKYIAKLQEEVNVLRELRGHENVIRLYDVFCVDNELFIITELGRGGDLFHLLTTHPKHGVTEAYAGTYSALMMVCFSPRITR